VSRDKEFVRLPQRLCMERGHHKLEPQFVDLLSGTKGSHGECPWINLNPPFDRNVAGGRSEQEVSTAARNGAFLRVFSVSKRLVDFQ
jgi:hypothetical protein